MKRSMLAASAICLCLGFIGLRAGLAQQPPPERVTGQVRYEESQQVAAAVQVELRDFAGRLISTAHTNNYGEFRFVGTPTGSFFLHVNVPGYTPIREWVDVSLGPIQGLQLYLRKITATGGPAASGASVSAHELGMPRKAREAYRKGMELASKMKPEEGVEQFHRALQEAPGFYEAYYEMGMAYVSLGKNEEAEQAFRLALQHGSKTYAPPFFGLAGVCVNMNKLAEAEATARAGLAIDGNSWQGHYELGRAQLGLGKLAEGEASVQAAKRLKPDFPSVHLLLANVHRRQKNYSALLEDLDAYLRLEPTGPMSDQARNLRDQVKKAVAQANNQARPARP